MISIEEIEKEIINLSHQDFSVFRKWFYKYDSDEWDKEIEEDANSGKLDKLAMEALEEHKSGRTKEI